MQEFLQSNTAAATVTLLTVALTVIFLRLPLLRFIAILPFRLIAALFRAIGLNKSTRHWSVVYDAASKEPIDPAYVTVRNPLGSIVASAVTDLDGRFNVLLSPGTYTIDVQKTNYVFPSSTLFGKRTDGKYESLYFGDKIHVASGSRSVTLSIPMDPIANDWNQKEKRRRNIFFHTARAIEYTDALRFYYSIALYLAFLRFVLIQDTGTFRAFFYYLAIGLLGALWHFVMPKEHYHSFVYDRKKKKPIGFARVGIYTARNKFKVAEKTTSLDGQFVALVPNGRYYVVIEERNAQGIYAPVYTSHSFRVRRGVIARRFAL